MYYNELVQKIIYLSSMGFIRCVYVQSMETLIMERCIKKFFIFFHFRLGMCIYRYRLWVIRIYSTVYNVHNIQILSFYDILSPFVVPFLLRGFPPPRSILFFGLPVTYVQQLYNLSRNHGILSSCLFYIITLVVYALKCLSSG